MFSTALSGSLGVALLQLGGLIPKGTRIAVFERIYEVFLLLGTIVGIVVISYLLWKAFKYRDHEGRPADEDVDRPQLGELPQSSGGGRKLLLSFSLSAIIVISLIVWTYGTLLYVETAPAQEEEDALTVEVEGYQFGWQFHYPNGYTADSQQGDAFRVPANRMVELQVTSRDVFHNFAITDLRVKVDAIPGQTTETWFRAENPDTHEAACYELCGAGHSYMNAEVVVMPQDEWNTWYANQSSN